MNAASFAKGNERRKGGKGGSKGGRSWGMLQVLLTQKVPAPTCLQKLVKQSHEAKSVIHLESLVEFKVARCAVRSVITPLPVVAKVRHADVHGLQKC